MGGGFLPLNLTTSISIRFPGWLAKAGHWKENIRRALELSPESLTIYQMEQPFNTVYSKDLLTGQQKGIRQWPNGHQACLG